jgi:dynein heavy chain
MLFEVQDLAVASPATVSRCGMVYLSFDNVHWTLYVVSWLEKHLERKDHQEFILGLFNKTLEKAFKKKKHLTEPFPTTLIQIAANICSILESMLQTMKLKDN